MKFLYVIFFALVLIFLLSACDSSDPDAGSGFELNQAARFCAGKVNVQSFSTNGEGYKVQCDNGDSAEVIVKRGSK